jgi:hypothetical protein
MIGRPDLDAWDRAGDPRVLPAWFQDGAYVVLPDALELASRPDGSPDLRLELARAADAISGPGEHGTLDLRLVAAARLEEALARLRAEDPSATVRPAAFDAGWLWLMPGEAVVDELAVPVALAGLGVGARRWTMRVSADTAALLRRLLVEDVLVLGARAHLELTGVAPRLPVKVRLVPRATGEALAALAPQGAATATVPVDVVERALRADPASLGLWLLGDVGPDEHERLVRTLLYLVTARVADSAPGTPATGPALTPLPADRLAATTVEYDLRTPFEARRALTLELNPLTAVREHVEQHGTEGLVVETVMPTLESGAHAVDVAGDLPSPRVGVLAVGAMLTAPPRPPRRPQAVVRSVEFTAPEDRAGVRFVLAPDEPLAYRVAGTAVLPTGQLLKGPPREATGAYVRIDVDDVPVRFVVVEAAPGLLALARVDGTVRATGAAAGAVSVQFALSADQPVVAVAVPAGSGDPLLDVRARPRFADAPVLTLVGLPGHDTRLDLLTFPGYGSHRVQIGCTWPAGARGDYVLELAPEADEAAVERVILRPQHPTAAWTYFAPSPFAPGYRFRRAAAPGAPPEPWSEPRSPLEPLALTATAPPAATWSLFENVRYAPSPRQPGAFQYLPLAPSCQLDPAGRPAVSLLAAGDAAFLQLAAQWDPPADALERLRAKLAEEAGAGSATLVPPQLSVDRCRLRADGDEIGSVATSGFPPWVALFALALDAGTRSAAMAALHGEPGRLTVTFEARLEGEPLQLDADVGAWFAGSPGSAQVVGTQSISGLGRFDAPRPTTKPEGASSAEDR